MGRGSRKVLQEEEEGQYELAWEKHMTGIAEEATQMRE